MSFLDAVMGEFRDRRLWALAAVLLVALVAVPLLLSKSYDMPPAAAAVPPSTPQAAPVPALSLKNGAITIPVGGSAYDPFTPQPGATSTSTTVASGSTTQVPSSTGGAASGSGTSTTSSSTSTTSSTGSSSSTTSSSTTSNGTGSSSTSSGGGTGGGSGTTNTTPTTPPATPADLAPAQAYRVTAAVTTPGGGLNTLASLTRLSILPSDAKPLLVELGVLKGGNRVVFAVMPGTTVSGPGRCTPGPLDCEVLSLAANQIESVSKQGSKAAGPIASFAVTAIARHDYGSASAALAVRKKFYAPGRRLLGRANLSALSLFQYKAGLGIVVDSRNLKSGFTG